jgi:hypothetical protein
MQTNMVTFDPIGRHMAARRQHNTTPQRKPKGKPMATNAPLFKSLAALVVTTWDNWDDTQFARNFDPMERIAQLAAGYDSDKPNCIAQLMYFYADNPLDLTLDQVVDLCREYVKA